MLHSITNRIPPPLTHLLNPKVHYRVHNRPSLVLIVSQTNPDHALPSYLLNINFNRIHLRPGLQSALLPSTNKIFFPHTWSKLRPFHPPVISSPKYLKKSTNLVPPDYAIFSRLLLLPPHQTQVSPQHLILDHPQACVLPLTWYTKFRTHTKQQQYFLWEIISAWSWIN